MGTGLQTTASDVNGTLVIALTLTENRPQLNFIDTQNVIRNLIPSVSGTLVYNGSTLVDLTYLTNNYTTTTSINTSLANKQDNITAGTGLIFSGNTLNTYKLYGNGVQTTSPIDDIMFQNLNCTEVLNTGTSRYEYNVEGLGLRWNTTSTPTAAIQDIHFKSGLTIAESLNISIPFLSNLWEPSKKTRINEI